MARLGPFREFLLPIGVIVSLMVILTPLPAMMMDFLLVANIAVSVIVLMTAIYVKSPLEFSVFPTVLLATAVGRLVLNIASTRLILTRAAQDGIQAAGGVIQGFGQFVAGDQILVGIVIFSIIAVIQFVVITKGATRISEVAARFTLDGMSGRQMAIDSDLNAGIIDEDEAKRRRNEILDQSEFYGAMDGASKFVRGDAIASVFITVINIVGGLVIGMISYKMSAVEALNVFTKLTIGDGLVSQMPALLVSLAAGTLITRSTRKTNLPLMFLNQLFARTEVLAIAAGFLVLLIVTSLPKIPLLVLGGSCACTAFVISRNETKASIDRQKSQAKKQQRVAAPEEPRIEELLAVDPIEVELGRGLIGLADSRRGGRLLPKITRLRKDIALDLGLVLPKVRIRDNLNLDENTYQIRVNSEVTSSARLSVTKFLAVGNEKVESATEWKHPLFPDAVYEIPVEERSDWEARGFHVYDAITVLILHLRQIVHDNADGLLNRDATKHLLDELRRTSPAIVDELVPHLMSIGQVQHVLQRLLRERIPIRQLSTILEVLGDNVGRLKRIVDLTEIVRRRLARTISHRFRDDRHRLHVVTLDPGLENRLFHACSWDDVENLQCQLADEQFRAFVRGLRAELSALEQEGRRLLVLVNPKIRPFMRPLLANEFPNLIVLSYSEITEDTKIVSMGIVEDIESA